MVALAWGCGPEVEDELADPENQFFAGAKADGFCADQGSDAADGVLALVNDPNVTFEMLDDPVSTGNAGLNRLAAEGIIEGRPFATLDELDAVPFVGVSACTSLRNFACGRRALCEPALIAMTWNVERFPLTSETLEEVALQLEQVGPDVITFQEIRLSSALGALATRLGNHEFRLGRGDGFSRTAVMVNKARVRIVSMNEIFADNRDAFPRAPVLAELAVQAGSFEVPLDFTGVHLKASEDGESRQRRREAIAALRQLLDDRAADGKVTSIVAGDWNDRLTDTGSLNVFLPFLDDPDRFDFQTLPLAQAGEFSFIPFRGMIDHILVTSASFGTLVPGGADVLELDETIPDYVERVSDHRPVISRFRLRPLID